MGMKAVVDRRINLLRSWLRRHKETTMAALWDPITPISSGSEQHVTDLMVITTMGTGLGIMPALRSPGLTGPMESQMTGTDSNALPTRPTLTPLDTIPSTGTIGDAIRLPVISAKSQLLKLLNRSNNLHMWLFNGFY